MKQSHKTINPQHYSYAFKFSSYDCFKVRTGKCSLNLTDKEYQLIKENDKQYGNGSSGYCRKFAKYLLDSNLFNWDKRLPS